MCNYCKELENYYTFELIQACEIGFDTAKSEPSKLLVTFLNENPVAEAMRIQSMIIQSPKKRDDVKGQETDETISLTNLN